MKTIFYLFFIFSLSACNEREQGPGKGKINDNTPDVSISVKEGQNWLKETIETFFNSEKEFKMGFSSLCTKQHAEFKQDATNVGYDGGMTKEAFKAKWGRRYSQYAGIGEGFMIAGNDFGVIEVTEIKFKNKTEMNGLQYDVWIVDRTFNSKFYRQVLLVKNKNSFLIDDVKEISNDFEERN